MLEDNYESNNDCVKDGALKDAAVMGQTQVQQCSFVPFSRHACSYIPPFECVKPIFYVYCSTCALCVLLLTVDP